MRTISWIAVWILAATSAGCMHATDPNDDTLTQGEQRRAEAKQRAELLMRRYETLERAGERARPTSSTTATCDAGALADRGLDEALSGQHREALRLYEASLACEFQPEVARHAFFSACQAQDTARARIHYQAFSNDPRRELLRQACISFGIDSLP